MDAPTRARLRTALSQRYGWLTDTQFGPAAVEAGECDACGAEARLIATCGPGMEQYLGRRCLTDRATDAFCDGHADEAAAAVDYVSALPGDADLIARIWWVSTGEVGFQPGDARIAENILSLPAAASSDA